MHVKKKEKRSRKDPVQANIVRMTYSRTLTKCKSEYNFVINRYMICPKSSPKLKAGFLFDSVNSRDSSEYACTVGLLNTLREE